MKNEVKVVAALIMYNDKFLIARRVKGDEVAEGKWEFPGGKIESNETNYNAIKREIKEEFNVEINPMQELTTYTTEYPTRYITITFIKCLANSVEVKMDIKDHSEYKWIGINDLNKYDFAKGDKAFVDYLKQL